MIQPPVYLRQLLVESLEKKEREIRKDIDKHDRQTDRQTEAEAEARRDKNRDRDYEVTRKIYITY